MSYVVNVSSIQDYMRCRYRWLCKWVLNRVPRSEGRALAFGKLLHKVYEAHLTGVMTMQESVDLHRWQWRCAWHETNDPDERRTIEEACADLHTYSEPLGLWEDQYPFEIPVLEVEQPFRVCAPHYAPGIEFIGRPDRMGVLWGKLFHVQNRSLNPQINFNLYTQLATRHLHEHVYAYAMMKKYPQYQYGGTVMNLLRKIKYRGVPTKKHPQGRILRPLDEVLWQGIVNISPEQNVLMIREASMYAQEMRAAEYRFREHGEWPLPNESMNAGFFGNTLDPYFLVLQGITRLDNDRLFKDREVLYG